MQNIIDILTDNCLLRIKEQTGFDDRSAQRLLAVHLDPRFFAMPIHGTAEEQKLREWSASEESGSAIEFLKTEDTLTMKGIVRVLLRTHINRQGVQQVRRAAAWPAQSPRVLDLVDVATSEEEIKSWLEYDKLMASWLAVARANHRTGVAADRYYDDLDLKAIERLAALSSDEAKSLTAPAAAKRLGLEKENWAKVVLGLYSGLHYLNDFFSFDAKEVVRRVRGAKSALEVDHLVKEARTNVEQFGPALSASFFADLGYMDFVKADVHVIDVTTAALNLSPKATPQQSIDYVRSLAAAEGVSPRAIDKLMYLSCKGNFYFAGVAISKNQANSQKAELLRKIRLAQTGIAISQPAGSTISATC